MPSLPEFHAYALKVPALEIFNDGIGNALKKINKFTQTSARAK